MNPDDWAARAGNQLAEEIDWDIMVKLLTEIGWVQVHTGRSKYQPDLAYEILTWARANCGHHKVRGDHWLFAEEKDAVMFMLRWL